MQSFRKCMAYFCVVLLYKYAKAYFHSSKLILTLLYSSLCTVKEMVKWAYRTHLQNINIFLSITNWKSDSWQFPPPYRSPYRSLRQEYIKTVSKPNAYINGLVFMIKLTHWCVSVSAALIPGGQHLWLMASRGKLLSSDSSLPAWPACILPQYVRGSLSYSLLTPRMRLIFVRLVIPHNSGTNILILILNLLL